MRTLLLIVWYSFTLCTAAVAQHSAAEHNMPIAERIYREQVPQKPGKKIPQHKLKKKSKKRVPRWEAHPELSFLAVALYLSLGAGAVATLSLFFELMFSMILLAGFFWLLSGLCAAMAVVMLLARVAKNQKEQNEQAAWYLILIIFTRIAFFVAMGVLNGPIVGIVLAVTFIPVLIAYIGTISAAFRNYASKKDLKKMKSMRD